MGPRMFIRGNRRTPAIYICAVALQWGRGCSSAETRGDLVMSARMMTLQWGRGCSSAETPDRDGALALAIASMGPRMFIRGNIRPADVGADFRTAASMGPRMFIRGNGFSASFNASSVSLQWGRGCSSAETAACVTDLTVQNQLQWGRGCSSAETRVVSRSSGDRQVASMGPRMFIRGNTVGRQSLARYLPSFNGAADVHPRKRDHHYRVGLDCHRRFNGAADVHPRKRPRNSPLRRPLRRFNGAADVHPRKHTTDGAGNSDTAASMGPRMFIRGNGVGRDQLSVLAG